jgi:hypothetical protein
MAQSNEERAEVLFDLLADSDQTYVTVQAATGWNRPQIMKAVQVLRDILAANGDVISVTAEPQGKGQPWLYSLRAGNQITNAEESRWINNRIGDAERRLTTIKHVLEVAVRALDGRTAAGQKARIYHMHLKRAEEEVALLVTNGDAA